MHVVLSDPASYLRKVLVLYRDAYVAKVDKVQFGIVSFPDVRNDLNIDTWGPHNMQLQQASLDGPVFGNACRWCLVVAAPVVPTCVF